MAALTATGQIYSWGTYKDVMATCLKPAIGRRPGGAPTWRRGPTA